MRIGWIASRYFPESIGGAEETDFSLIEEGKKKGYIIDRLTEPTNESYDYFVISNFHDWNREKVWKIIDEKRYAVFRHDVFKIEDAIEILRGSFCNIFMSPLQHSYYQSKLVLHDNYFMTPCAFKTLDIYNPNEEKKNIYVYIGDVVPHKGILNIANYAAKNPEKKFYAYGNIYGNYNLPSNLKLMGFVSPQKVPEILAESKYFIHLPEKIDTCPRIDAAAYLSGCELIYNENVGLFSWPWDWKNMNISKLKKILEKHKSKFWDELDSFYKKNLER